MQAPRLEPPEPEAAPWPASCASNPLGRQAAHLPREVERQRQHAHAAGGVARHAQRLFTGRPKVEPEGPPPALLCQELKTERRAPPAADFTSTGKTSAPSGTPLADE